MVHYKKALAIQTKALGKKHADLGSTYNNIACTLQGQAKFAEAMEYFNKAVAVLVAALGLDHARVGNVYLGIGEVHEAQLEYVEALSKYNQCSAIFDAVNFAEQHPLCKQLAKNIASVKKKM